MTQTTDFTSFSTERPNYFPGQYLLEDDFELQHKYLSDRQKYYHQSLHISGIIEGLEVEVVVDKKAVQIKSGSAINSQGELIILKEEIEFSDFKTLTNGELYIEYFEDKQVRQQEEIPDSYTRWKETSIVRFAATTPENGVKLATLIIVEDEITIDGNSRNYSGISLPNANGNALTLNSGGKTNPNLAVLTGSLKIDGNLTVTGTGNSSFEGDLTVSGAITPSVGNTENKGIIFPKNPSGGSGDSAWIRYYQRGNSGDATTFEMGTSNDSNDHIALMSSGGVGIGINNPTAKLEVNGDLKVTNNAIIQDLQLGTAKNQKFIIHSRQNHNQSNGDFLQITYDNQNGSWNWKEGITLKRGGNVGIGITNPGNYKLNVQGNQYVSGNLTVNGSVSSQNLSLAIENNKRGTLFLASTGDYNHALYNNFSNIDNEGSWDGVKWNVFDGLNIKIGGGTGKNTAFYINRKGNIGIGTDSIGDDKLNVQGSQYVSGNLTVNGTIAGKIAVNDTRNNDDPPTAFNKSVSFDFKNRNTVKVPGSGTYSGMLTIAPWSDNSGDAHHQLNFNEGGIFWRQGQPNANSWQTWYRMANDQMTDDFSFGGNLTATGTFTVNTGGSSTWNKLVVNTTSEWGDDDAQYVTIGAGGAAGIMLSNPHVTWRDKRASIRYGRSGGVSSGSYWDAGVRSDGSFSFSLDGVSDHKLTIEKNGQLRIGQLYATTGTGNLRIIRGLIRPNGNTYSGEGFTSKKVSTGLYDITFKTAFSDHPAVIATQDYPGKTSDSGGNTRDNAVVVGISKNKCRIKCGNGNGDASDRYFSFLCIGT